MLDYINNPDIVFLNFIQDTAWPITCDDWGHVTDNESEGQNLPDFPIIINELDNENQVGDWFYTPAPVVEPINLSSPWHIFIDHNFYFHAITGDKDEVDGIIEQMLNELNGE